MKPIVLATAEPTGNYHFASFDENHSKNLLHLVSSVGGIQGSTYVETTDNMEVLHKASLVVLVGGVITEWTRHIGFMANEIGVPVVYSEMAYVNSSPVDFHLPDFIGYSAVSPYGVFNIKGFFNENDIDVEITGHPFLDNLPVYAPHENRILIMSSVFKKDNGYDLRNAIKELEANGYNVTVRTHPRESIENWKGFQISTLPLIQDLAISQAMVGVPGTAFLAAAALGVPTLALEDSVLDTTLPEFKYLFRYIHARDVVQAIKDVQPVDEDVKRFLVGPIGEDINGKNSADRLIEFWNNHRI